MGVENMSAISHRLANINQEIRYFTRAAFAGDITYITAMYEIQKLAEERERLWTQ